MGHPADNTNRSAGQVDQRDLKLMQEVATGDESALGELYDRFGAMVYRAARQVLHSGAEAEDAVQEVFVRLWQSADRYDPRRAQLVTWVMLITRRHLIDRLRRKSVRPTATGLDPEWPETGAVEPAEVRSPEESRQLMGRIAELPKLQREVIEKAYFQGFTLREISRQLDAPLGTIKSALSRGLAKLREQVQQEDRASG